MCHNGAEVKSANSSPNLRYDRLHLIGKVEFEGKPLEFIVDTGNQAGTQLWERFGRDFDALVKDRGRKDTIRVTQVGGSTDREVVVLPPLQLTIGGMETTLPVANIFSRPVGDNRYYGLLGIGLLNQAEEVTIDFRSMSLAFCVLRSAFFVLRSAFFVLRSAFCVRRSSFVVRRSPFTCRQCRTDGRACE
jgi:hypothetical protein